MSKLKLIPILIFVALFAYLLSLPSARSTQSHSEVQKQLSAIPYFDYIEYGMTARYNGQEAKAITLFSIAARSVETAERAQAEITKTLIVLKAQTSMLASLNLMGNLSSAKNNSWDVQQDRDISLFFDESNIEKLSTELLVDNTNSNKFLITLQNVDSITEVMPNSTLAFQLLNIAESTHLLSNELKFEITHSINAYNKSDIINPALLETVLDSTIPTLQLMKQCQTWNQFATMMPYVKSSRHVSILLGLISSSKDAAATLTELLNATDNNSELGGSILGYVNDKGMAGLNNLHRAISKGAPALQILVDNPNDIISDLRIVNQDKTGAVKEWWIKTAKVSPVPMEAVRYILMAISICAIILCGVQSQHLARVILIKDPEQATTSKVALQLCVIVFSVFALSFIFNTLLSAQVDVAVSDQATLLTSSSTQTSAAVQPSQNALTGMSILSLVIIVFMQFTVYAKAVSELKKIKELTGTSLLKLKQLKHADIFFDLPIYLGLLGTVSSFIIMLFDPAASRIVAYTSTIIGIIFSASIRIFYVYPLQKDLTNESENITEVVD